MTILPTKRRSSTPKAPAKQAKAAPDGNNYALDIHKAVAALDKETDRAEMEGVRPPLVVVLESLAGLMRNHDNDLGLRLALLNDGVAAARRMAIDVRIPKLLTDALADMNAALDPLTDICLDVGAGDLDMATNALRGLRLARYQIGEAAEYANKSVEDVEVPS